MNASISYHFLCRTAPSTTKGLWNSIINHWSVFIWRIKHGVCTGRTCSDTVGPRKCRCGDEVFQLIGETMLSWSNLHILLQSHQLGKGFGLKSWVYRVPYSYIITRKLVPISRFTGRIGKYEGRLTNCEARSCENRLVLNIVLLPLVITSCSWKKKPRQRRILRIGLWIWSLLLPPYCYAKQDSLGMPWTDTPKENLPLVAFRTVVLYVQRNTISISNREIGW